MVTIMAHELSILENGKAEAAYAKTGAWHGLGTVHFDAMTSEEAMSLSNVGNWTVSLERQFHNGISQDFWATIRSDTGKMLGCGFSDGYNVLQNKEAFSFMDSLSDMGMRYESAFALRGGKQVVLLARMPEVDTVAEGDNLQRYLMLYNSHDGSGAVEVFMTSVRVICANTVKLAFATKTGGLSVRHTKKMQDRLATAATILKSSSHEFGKNLDNARKLAEKKIDSASFVQYLDVLFPAKSKEDTSKGADTRRLNKIAEITSIFKNEPTCNIESIRNTWWAAFNAVTFKFDHAGDYRKAAGTVESEVRFDYMTSGSGADTKVEAMEVALAMAA